MALDSATGRYISTAAGGGSQDTDRAEMAEAWVPAFAGTTKRSALRAYRE